MTNRARKAVFSILSLICFASLSAARAESLSCPDFGKILQFVKSEHLRFQVEDDTSFSNIVQSSVEQVSEVLRFEGAYLLAAEFDRYWPAQIANPQTLHSIPNLCAALMHTHYREAFLKAFVGSLDPFSQFYSSKELEKKTSVVDGHFVGVGIGTKSYDAYLEIVEIVDGGPSDGKVQLGDRITHIDEHPVRGLSAFDLRQRIRGPLHSEVVFRIQRNSEVSKVKIVRDHVYQKSLSHSWMDEDILSVKIHRFYAHTASQLSYLIRENRSRTKGLILDLRDNPGGLLQAARDVVDVFVSQGVVVHLKGSYQDQMWALGDQDFLDLPLVVLINEKTASASEIVAGALQDYGRAVLVGRQTFGKSCVQNIYETHTALGTTYEGGLKLTTLWFYLPSGRSVQNLKPDIQVTASATDSVERFHMPFDYPQQIEVIAFPSDKESISKSLKSFKGRFEAYSESEEVGRALIRQLAVSSQADQ